MIEEMSEVEFMGCSGISSAHKYRLEKNENRTCVINEDNYNEEKWPKKILAN